VEPSALAAVAIPLIAVAMVHGADEGWTASGSTAAVLAVLPATTTTASLPSLVGSVLVLLAAAKAASATPRFPIARVLRLVQSIIHSITCELWFYPPDLRKVAT
jgi:hypothetical protein